MSGGSDNWRISWDQGDPSFSSGKQLCGSKRSWSDFGDLGSVCGIACYSVAAVDR